MLAGRGLTMQPVQEADIAHGGPIFHATKLPLHLVRRHPPDLTAKKPSEPSLENKMA